ATLEASNFDFNSIYSVGVGVPGSVDHKKQLCVLLPNVPGNWDGFPLGRKIRESINIPTFIINDCRAITLGEAK
ncbi:unnamed protein product, partial [marine sediment metagenome]